MFVNWASCQKWKYRGKKEEKWKRPGTGGKSPINNQCHCIILYIPRVKKIMMGGCLKELWIYPSRFMYLLGYNIQDIVLHIVKTQAACVCVNVSFKNLTIENWLVTLLTKNLPPNS